MSDQRWSVTPQSRRLLESVARQIGDRIKHSIDGSGLEKQVGYCLLLFTWQPGFLTHMSNGDRADVAKMLREYADVLEQGTEERPLQGGPTDA